jgi:hypothetical protein
MMPYSAENAAPTFGTEWCSALQPLLDHYQEDPEEQWTERELAHLRFVRWLVQTDQLVEDGEPSADAARATRRWVCT